METWIAEVVGKMHIHRITQEALAERVGVRREHICKVLGGKESGVKLKDKILTAVDEMIEMKS